MAHRSCFLTTSANPKTFRPALRSATDFSRGYDSSLRRTHISRRPRSDKERKDTFVSPASFSHTMRSFVSLIATSVLLASNAFAQGGPPAWAGGPGNGQPPPHAVDPLASNKYWTPSPGPVVPHYNGVGGFWRPFGSQPGQAAPGGPPGGWSGSPQLGPGGNIPGVPPVAPAAPGGGQANAMPGIPGMSGGGPLNPIQGGGESQLKQETDFPGIPTKCTMVSSFLLRIRRLSR